MKSHPSITSSLDYLYSIRVAQSDRRRGEGGGGERERKAETKGKKYIEKRNTLISEGGLREVVGSQSVVPFQK